MRTCTFINTIYADKFAVRKILKKPAAQFMSVNLDEVRRDCSLSNDASLNFRQYLVEVKKNEKREIPVTWEVVSR